MTQHNATPTHSSIQYCTNPVLPGIGVWQTHCAKGLSTCKSKHNMAAGHSPRASFSLWPPSNCGRAKASTQADITPLLSFLLLHRIPRRLLIFCSQITIIAKSKINNITKPIRISMRNSTSPSCMPNIRGVKNTSIHPQSPIQTPNELAADEERVAAKAYQSQTRFKRTHAHACESAPAPAPHPVMQADMSGVKTMLELKMDSHQAVWDAFVSQRDAARSRLEADVGALAAELRAALAAVRPQRSGVRSSPPPPWSCRPASPVLCLSRSCYLCYCERRWRR
eukprot:366449-Chlamydomonas_euryale.AAC.21